MTSPGDVDELGEYRLSLCQRSGRRVASFDIRKSCPLGIGDEPLAGRKRLLFQYFWGFGKHIDLPKKYVFYIQKNVIYASGRKFAAWTNQSGLSFEQSILFGISVWREHADLEASCNNFFLCWGMP